MAKARGLRPTKGQALLEMSRDAMPPCEEATHPTAAQAECLDAETGLASREYFGERFEAEILRAQRSQRALTLIFLDVDSTRMAHDAGSDEHSAWVLPAIAAALLTQTR